MTFKLPTIANSSDLSELFLISFQPILVSEGMHDMKLNQTLKLTLATLALTAAAGAQSLTGSLQALKAINTVRPAAVVELHTAPKKHYALLGSMAFMATGQMLDCASSIGGHEMNGMIGNGRDGRLNASRGFAIKGAIVGGIVVGEYLLHRRAGHSLDAVLAGANATYGSIGLMAAFHNYGVKK